MKTQTIIGLSVIAAVLALAGCGPTTKEEPSAATPPASPPATTTQAPKGAALGTEEQNDHFSITLTAEPAELKVGKVKFLAKVMHHGQPTDAATVKLSLSMPTMNMGGPDVELKATKDGMYEGEAELSMGGDWQGKVTVEQEGHPGEAVYGFVVMQ